MELVGEGGSTQAGRGGGTQGGEEAGRPAGPAAPSPSPLPLPIIRHHHCVRAAALTDAHAPVAVPPLLLALPRLGLRQLQPRHSQAVAAADEHAVVDIHHAHVAHPAVLNVNQLNAAVTCLLQQLQVQRSRGRGGVGEEGGGEVVAGTPGGGGGWARALAPPMQSLPARLPVQEQGIRAGQARACLRNGAPHTLTT